MLESSVFVLFIWILSINGSANADLTHSHVSLREGNRRIAQVNLEELEDFDYWQQLCRLQTAARKYAEAQKSCEKAIELEPKEASIWADHSGVLLRLEQYPEAIASAQLSLSYNANNSLALTYQCMAFFALQEYEAGLDNCNDALRVNGDWGNESPVLAWRHRGQILDRQGQFEQALVAYRRTLLLQPEDSQILTLQCQAQIKLERYEPAIKSCQDALAVDRNWESETPGRAWFYQGVAHRALKQFEEAIRAYDQSVAIDPEKADTWIQQAFLLDQLGRPTEALTSYARAVELAPDSSQALVGQCTVLNQLQRYEEALAACQQALQGDGNWRPIRLVQAWSEQAQALAGAGQLEEALAASNRAVGIDPEFAEAWSNRSVVLWYFGIQQETPEQTMVQFEEAKRSARRAAELDPEAVRPLANLGRILRSQGQLFSDWGRGELAAVTYQRAVDAYEEALNLDREDAGIWSNYSVVLWLQGRYDAALSSANRAVYLDKTSPQAWQNRGAALAALDRYQAAVVSYQQVVMLDDQNAVAWASLGILQLQLDQVDMGMESLGKALALDPEQPLAKEALDRLSQVLSEQ